MEHRCTCITDLIFSPSVRLFCPLLFRVALHIFYLKHQLRSRVNLPALCWDTHAEKKNQTKNPNLTAEVRRLMSELASHCKMSPHESQRHQISHDGDKKYSCPFFFHLRVEFSREKRA